MTPWRVYHRVIRRVIVALDIIARGRRRWRRRRRASSPIVFIFTSRRPGRVVTVVSHRRGWSPVFSAGRGKSILIAIAGISRRIASRTKVVAIRWIVSGRGRVVPGRRRVVPCRLKAVQQRRIIGMMTTTAEEDYDIGDEDVKGALT